MTDRIDEPRLHSQLRQGFARAAEAAAAELVEARLSLAGRPVEWRVVGSELARQVLTPLAHLRDPSPRGDPELRVELWDESVSGVPLGVPSPSPGLYLGDGDRRTAVHAAEGALTAIDRGSRVVSGWRRAAAMMPLEERWRAQPSILPLWYIDRGVNLIHAALVARGGHGILLAGEGGVGKSTTSLACAAAGFEFLGDDQVGLEETADGFVGHSLHLAARLTPATLERHPELACGGRVEQLDEKALVIPGPGARFAASVPIRQILLPRVAASRSGVSAVTPGKALLALAPTSLLGGGGHWAMQRLGRLVRRVPAHWLDVNGEPADAVELIGRVLDELER